jgi:small subunit ribosomal protein S8
MLTRLRNALMARHTEVEIPYSRIKREIARVLHEEGYIEGFEIVEGQPFNSIRIKLKYFGRRRDRQPVITGLRRISKPGRRIYVNKDEIPWVLSGMGIAILTTNQGLMTGHQARRNGIGGEVLCYVW